MLDPTRRTWIPGVLELGVPILGICYGQQLLAQAFGGRVEAAREREYGRRSIELVNESKLFAGTPAIQDVWMSHGDRVLALPAGFEVVARSENSPFAAIRHQDRAIWGVQFHPEVVHTEYGTQILENFVHGSAAASELDDGLVRRRTRSRRSASRWAMDVRSAACPAASIPRSRRRWSIARSATSSPASSSTTA